MCPLSTSDRPPGAADDVHEPVVRPIDCGISGHAREPVQIERFLDHVETVRAQLSGDDGLNSIGISAYAGFSHERLQEGHLCIEAAVHGGDDTRLKFRA